MKNTILALICLVITSNLYAQVVTIKFDENHEQTISEKLFFEVEKGALATIIVEVANPAAADYNILINQEKIELKDGKAVYVKQLEELGKVAFSVSVSIPTLDKGCLTSIIYDVAGESASSTLPEGEDFVLHKINFNLNADNMLIGNKTPILEGAVGEWLSITTFLKEHFEGQYEVRINGEVIADNVSGNATFTKQIKSEGKQSYGVFVYEYDEDGNPAGTYSSTVYFEAKK